MSLSSLPLLKQNGWRQRLDNKAVVCCNGQSPSTQSLPFVQVLCPQLCNEFVEEVKRIFEAEEVERLPVRAVKCHHGFED